MNTIWIAYESDYDDEGAFFATKALAEEYRDRKTGSEVLFIREDYVHDSPMKDVLLYGVHVNLEGKAFNVSPERCAVPGHEVKTHPIGFGDGRPVKYLKVHVEAKDRAEAIENALRVAKGIGFIE